jgi:hypothetical protein
VAAQNTPQGVKTAFDGTMAGDSFRRISGTSWIKTAGSGQERRYASLVNADKAYQKHPELLAASRRGAAAGRKGGGKTPQREQFLFQVAVIQLLRVLALFCHHRYIKTSGQYFLPQAKKFSEQPLYPVALHGSADFPADCKAAAPGFS